MPSMDAVYWLTYKSQIITVLTKAFETPETSIDNWFSVVVEDANKASHQLIKELI
jgi:hypothetical protein